MLETQRPALYQRPPPDTLGKRRALLWVLQHERCSPGVEAQLRWRFKHPSLLCDDDDGNDHRAGILQEPQGLTPQGKVGRLALNPFPSVETQVILL